MTSDGISRRNALTGAATVGVGLPLLAACGGDDEDTGTDPSGSGGSSTPSESGGSGGSGGSDALASTSDIPVGGGEIFADETVVVTQPTEGDIKAFTAICPHQGCVVSSVEVGTINCACHGSQFSIEDGSVVKGPATSALDAVKVSVEGNQISLA